jgi:deoxyribodipyrimidine photolyase-related protein
MSYKKLRLLLGDQLNHQHSWFEQKDPETLYVLMEMLSETNYVAHHIQKVVGFFLAMRQFAKELKAEGHKVLYWQLDEEKNKQSIPDNIKYLVDEFGIESFEYLLPDEYRLDEQLKAVAADLDIPVSAYDTEHFLGKREAVEEFFEGKKRYTMEYFYRRMRADYDLLMEADGKTPLTGQWNYDHSNRKKYPKKIEVPDTKRFERDATEVVELIKSFNIETIGRIPDNIFDYPISRTEGLQALEDFNTSRLIHFGDYQDAMSEEERLGYHSRISFALNTKLITPLEVVQSSIAHWHQHSDEIDISQIEGFVRQIVGWREYMRGMYWLQMPELEEKNYFNHQAKLPSYYWDGETKMNCMSNAINQSLDLAYAHHIQRLMVTGNFALLLGVHPDEVDAWYLGIYIDAIQWVEITNTRCMSQFADGGKVATKPYVSSANYIHKMSDYCKNCYYDRNKKYGDKACPFNSLFWDFYDRNAKQLSHIGRINMMMGTWNKMDGEEREKILAQAAEYKAQADEL